MKLITIILLSLLLTTFATHIAKAEPAVDDSLLIVQLLSMPDREFFPCPTDTGRLAIKDLISLAATHWDDAGVSKYKFGIEIESKENFITFCKNHTLVKPIMWKSTFLNKPRIREDGDDSISPAIWEKAYAATKVYQVNGLTAYSLWFSWRVSVVHLIVFSNGIVFVTY